MLQNLSTQNFYQKYRLSNEILLLQKGLSWDGVTKKDNSFRLQPNIFRFRMK